MLTDSRDSLCLQIQEIVLTDSRDSLALIHSRNSLYLQIQGIVAAYIFKRYSIQTDSIVSQSVLTESIEFLGYIFKRQTVHTDSTEVLCLQVNESAHESEG